MTHSKKEKGAKKNANKKLEKDQKNPEEVARQLLVDNHKLWESLSRRIAFNA